jgi:hypothetical protein
MTNSLGIIPTRILGISRGIGTELLSCGNLAWLNHWIGLRENLQETMAVNCPIIQFYDSKMGEDGETGRRYGNSQWAIMGSGRRYSQCFEYP